MRGKIECLKWLFDNPGKVLKTENFLFCDVRYIEDEGVVEWLSLENIWVNGTDFTMFDRCEWQPEPQKVTWQEAIEAWTNGKEIKCIYGDRTSVYKSTIDTEDEMLLDDINLEKNEYTTVAKDEIKHGTWFIL